MFRETFLSKRSFSFKVPQVTSFNKSVAITFFQFVKNLLSFIVGVLLARQLGPVPFGEFALALVFLSVIESLRDFGYTSVAVQNRERDKDFDFDFTLSVSRGFLASLITGLVALLFSYFSSSAEFANIHRLLLIMSIVPIISATGAAYEIQLWRESKVKTLLYLDLLAIIASFAFLPILLVVDGSSAVLAYQLVIYTLFKTLLKVIYIRKLPARLRLMSINVWDGASLGWSNLLRTVASNFDSLVIGSWLGVKSLGLYNRAYQLTFVPIQQVFDSQGYYVLSKAGLEKAAREVNRIHNFFAGILIPWFLISTFQAKEIVATIFGIDWEESYPVFSYLAIAGIVRTLEYKIHWFLYVQQENKFLATAVILQQLSIIVAILLSVQFGINAIGQSLASVYSVSFLLQYIFAMKKFKRSFSVINESMRIIIFLTGIGTLGLFIIEVLIIR